MAYRGKKLMGYDPRVKNLKSYWIITYTLFLLFSPIVIPLLILAYLFEYLSIAMDYLNEKIDDFVTYVRSKIIKLFKIEKLISDK